MKNLLLLIATALLMVQAKAQDTMPKPAVAIIDKPNLLTPEQEKSIQQIITHLEQTKETKAYLLIIDSLPKGQNVLEFTKGIFKKWELNTSNDGMNLIMVYSKKEHAIRVEVSDKVLAILTKDYIQEVIATSIKPALKQRKDYEGLKRGMDMFAKKIENN